MSIFAQRPKNEGKVLPLLNQGLSYRKIAKQFGMSKDTISKISNKHQLV
jgi:transposase